MARPTGRYFAPVINKIRQLKQSERIMVDERFKLQLRQQLLLKAATLVEPPRERRFMKLSFLKSYMAVVPAFALVIVAVAGISQLPITFKSSTVVPAADMSLTTQIGDRAVSSNHNPVEQPDASTTPEGIKTFPGRLVLPSKYTQAQPQATDASVFQSDPVMTSSSFVTPSSSPDSSPVNSPLTDINNQPRVTGSSPSQSSPLVTASQPVVDLKSGNLETVRSSSSAPSAGGSSPLISSKEQAFVQTAPSSNSSAAASLPSQSPATVDKKPVLSDAKKSLTGPQLQQTPSVALVDIATLPLQHINTRIVFDGNFSKDERTLLEKNIVPYIIQGKGVDYVRVVPKTNTSMVIELHYAGQKVEPYNYFYNITAGTFHLEALPVVQQ